MHIRWTFAFETNSLSVDVRDENEDVRISDCVNNFVDLLLIPSVGKDAYINLKFCRAIVREIVNEEAKPSEGSNTPQPAETQTQTSTTQESAN